MPDLMSRLDEFPNLLNVLRGELSVAGPLPHVFDHAVELLGAIPQYLHRFRVRPFLIGVAKVRMGRADPVDPVRRRARRDSFCVEKARMTKALYVLARTGPVMVTGFGVK